MRYAQQFVQSCVVAGPVVREMRVITGCAVIILKLPVYGSILKLLAPNEIKLVRIVVLLRIIVVFVVDNPSSQPPHEMVFALFAGELDHHSCSSSHKCHNATQSYDNRRLMFPFACMVLETV